MLINGMNGLGDSLYQRVFVRNLPTPLYLRTPWPQLYSDLPGIQFVQPPTRLRTQCKNMARLKTAWVHPLREVPREIRYGSEGILTGMRRSFLVEPGVLDLPPLPASPVGGNYIVVRPVTIRMEWRAISRNPLPEYVARAAEVASAAGLKVVSVADLAPGLEWALDPLPTADITFHNGELDVLSLLALVKNARAIIGGIGWIVPASMASKVPAFIICGGCGGFNHPSKITGRGIDSSHIHFVLPDRMCMCTAMAHACPSKRISGFEKHISDFAGQHFDLARGRRHGIR